MGQTSHYWQDRICRMISAMIVLVGIALILVLLVVLGPAEQRPGFTSQPSSRSTDRDDVRVVHDLQLLR